MDTLKRQARIAGVLYLLACIPGPFYLIYVPRALFVAGDAAATANRVRASETLVRMGIAGELISSIFLALAVLALYRLFKGVSEKHAQAMVTLLLVSIPISLVNVLNSVAVLVLVGGARFLSSFDGHQLDTLAYLFLRLHSQGFVVAQIFWGLWLFPYGILVMRSGFIPSALGALLMIAGSGYVLSSTASLFLPQGASMLSQIGLALAAAEVPILFWLLIWGARVKPSGAPVQSRA
jgi:hypothetical protein